MELLIVVLSVLMIILLLGMIGDKEPENRRNFTYGFCTVVLALIVVILKSMK